IARNADTIVVVVNPGWGDSVQANKAGLLEIADVFVINKSDRPGADQTQRDLEQMLELSEIASGAWRPMIVRTTGTTGEGVEGLWQAITAHREHSTKDGSLAKRREQRLRNELRAIIERRLEDRAREVCTGARWDAIQNEVLSHLRDPLDAADEMLAGIL
ncbi:MAG: methylmalonyl Co-A mutase-associated GTPase MeaB, partial [Actinobacteria bacterium]|nr:methylmalonyl Co-A mutase-associated GTPase MeaB [Actinomycetota bacterium]